MFFKSEKYIYAVLYSDVYHKLINYKKFGKFKIFKQNPKK